MQEFFMWCRHCKRVTKWACGENAQGDIECVCEDCDQQTTTYASWDNLMRDVVA